MSCSDIFEHDVFKTLDSVLSEICMFLSRLADYWNTDLRERILVNVPFTDLVPFLLVLE